MGSLLVLETTAMFYEYGYKSMGFQLNPKKFVAHLPPQTSNTASTPKLLEDLVKFSTVKASFW